MPPLLTVPKPLHFDKLGFFLHLNTTEQNTHNSSSEIRRKVQKLLKTKLKKHFHISGAGPQCAVQGLCTNTTILDSVSGKTHAECLKFCQDTANCKWYSYILSSQYCMAFGDDCSIDPKCIDCRSGQVSSFLKL